MPHSNDLRPFAIQLSEAIKFFNDPAYPHLETDPPYADKDGLIEFITGTELVDDPVVMDQLETLKKYLIAITSIVTDYVLRYAAAYGEQYKTDIELWTFAMSKVPLLGPSKIDPKNYSRHIPGVKIAPDFVQFLLGIVAEDGSSALNKFSGFLQKQGEILRVGVEENKDYYSTITIGISVEVKSAGKQIVYIPKIEKYKVRFNRQNSQWSRACMSYEYVNIDFDYLVAANIFDYVELEDPETKKEFDKFIKDQRKAQIENYSTFFNSDFPPKK